MEEAKLKEILEIVKAMNATGMGPDDIKRNLLQIGLSEPEVYQILEQAKPSPLAAEIHEKVKGIEEKAVTKEEVKPLVEKTEEVREAVQDISAGLEEHAESLEEVTAGLLEHKEKIGEIHEEVRASSEEMSLVLSELKSLKELMLEMKPMIAALKDINEKILEANREMLMRIKK